MKLLAIGAISVGVLRKQFTLKLSKKNWKKVNRQNYSVFSFVMLIKSKTKSKSICRISFFFVTSNIKKFLDDSLFQKTLNFHE